MPFRQFVLKVHSRCDLACDHCYVYEHADQSWRARPKVIGSDTVSTAGERIAEHARRHALAGVRVILHGGEPLLVGAPRLGEIARTLRAAVERVCPLDLRIHTNGVRLDKELCELFLAERVSVGVSVDGDRAANDLHRRFANGKSSYDHVIRAVTLLREDRYREIYAGLLCTVDVRSDPVACYRALAGLEPPALDFLLPHGTWDSPPPGIPARGVEARGVGAQGASAGPTPYADWLAAVFEEWLAAGRLVPVRMFESIIATTHGGASRTESLGLEPSDVLVIETDGAIEQADSLKVAYDGAPATGLDIFAHSLDAASVHPGVRARRQGLAGLCTTCRQCPVVTSCGGGLYAHRYRSGNGFDNPSVYCADLEKIITHLRARSRPAPAPQDRRQPAHRLPGEEFDALAAGFGDGTSIAHLISGQRSIRRALLQLLHDRATKADGLFLAGWELLARVQREDAPAVNEVLDHPYVRAWAERCLRGAGQPAGGALPPDSGHLASIAAAAAARAGATADVAVPVRANHVHLPTLGRLRVGAVRTASVRTDAAGFEVRAGSRTWRVDIDDPAPARDWAPVRLLRAGRAAVRLEDTDPYRDCHQWPAAARLSDADAARWQEQFSLAWELIESCYPAYAPGLAAGLSTLMPLASDASGGERSSAARPAFGAVAAALTVEPAVLALLLIHEFQHVKLGAVLDLFELCDANAAPGRLFYAPWRDDPRPVEALLQGTYAHVGVTDYWRARRHALTGQEAADAAERFVRWRAVTAGAIQTLADSGALTSLGERFVAGLRGTVTPWCDEPVPEAAAEAARHWVAERQEAWQRLRDMPAVTS